MNQNPLQFLTTDNFILEAGFLRPPVAMRRHLRKLRTIGQIALAVRTGSITGSMVRSFAAECTTAFQRGSLLPHELGLAALAVALEACEDDFAEEYLFDLSRLNLPELRTAIGVARECLKGHLERPRTEVRTFNYPLRVTIKSGTLRIQSIHVHAVIQFVNRPARFPRRFSESNHA